MVLVLISVIASCGLSHERYEVISTLEVTGIVLNGGHPIVTEAKDPVLKCSPDTSL